MRFLSKEITTLPRPITNKTEIDITTEALSSAMASAEQIPNTRMVIGLLSARDSVLGLRLFLIVVPY